MERPSRGMVSQSAISAISLSLCEMITQVMPCSRSDAAQGFHFVRPLPLGEVPGSWHGRPCAARAPAAGGDHRAAGRHSVVADGGRCMGSGDTRQAAPTRAERSPWPAWPRAATTARPGRA